MGHKASKLLLISTGAALAWFLDPVSGADRRRQVTGKVSGLTGGSPAPSDPTGGAVPPYMAPAQPPPAAPPLTPVDPLLQAVDPAATGDTVLGTSSGAEDEADRNRAALRTSW